MPRQLPGLYWDDDRQRYFPLSSSPPSPVQPAQQNQPALVANRPRPLSDLRSVIHTARKDALVHQIRSSQLLLTRKVTCSAIPSGAPLSAFHSVWHDGRVWSFAGNTLGWVYSSICDNEQDELASWQPQSYLSSEVSSICVSGTTCVATSFGPDCRILYAPLDRPMEIVHRIDTHRVHDIWTADLQGSRLVLGANKQAVMIQDIAGCAPLQRLPTQSDVLALAQRDVRVHLAFGFRSPLTPVQYAVYTGLRNGGVLRFDTRLQRSNSHPLFDGVSQCTSSITGLRLLRDHELLVSFIDGDASISVPECGEAAQGTTQMSTFDLRFPIRTPSMTFTGNFNRYTVRLPLAIDPCEKFLFAAGQDNMIRLWSLTTGGPALGLDGTGSGGQAVFQRPFEQRVAALQVVEKREGTYLLATSGTELYEYSLGHRSEICM